LQVVGSLYDEYGIDDDGPTATALEGTVSVPNVEHDVENDQCDILQHFDPMKYSDNFGVDIYIYISALERVLCVRP
jgi:hypothetical protein